MAEHLKTRIIKRLEESIATFETLPAGATPHVRGVRYFRAEPGVDALWGAMDMEKEGRKYRKRIIVRRSRFRDGLFELYTYHFPKKWSVACVANRELIKEAQRRAHALEKDCSPEGLEWRVRFFKHYFRVFKGGEKPAEGMKAYSRFYQYVYVAIYRELQQKVNGEKVKSERRSAEEVKTAAISFAPIDLRQIKARFSTPWSRAYNYFRKRDLQNPENQPPPYHLKIPRTTEEFAYFTEKQYLCTQKTDRR